MIKASVNERKMLRCRKTGRSVVAMTRRSEPLGRNNPLGSDTMI